MSNSWQIELFYQGESFPSPKSLLWIWDTPLSGMQWRAWKLRDDITASEKYAWDSEHVIDRSEKCALKQGHIIIRSGKSARNSGHAITGYGMDCSCFRSSYLVHQASCPDSGSPHSMHQMWCPDFSPHYSTAQLRSLTFESVIWCTKRHSFSFNFLPHSHFSFWNHLILPKIQYLCANKRQTIGVVVNIDYILM